ncbi:MAG: hypothetical protein ABL907_03520 [Hyphomicrobium sp.]
MPYEALSRALAYASCLSTMSLFATTMAIAVVNVGKLKPPQPCGPAVCTARIIEPANPYGGLTSKAHIEAIAAVLWSKKT